MIRRIIRHPKILTTPRLLAQALNVPLRRSPGNLRPVSLRTDFLMTAPPLDAISPLERLAYQPCFNFWASTKKHQRLSITQAGLNTPAMNEAPYVVRPLRHQGGNGFRVTQEPGDFNPATEYICSLFKKDTEYRIIYVYGKPVLLLRKQPNEGVGFDAPWNFGNSHFVTVDDVPRSNLRTHTDIYDKLAQHDVIRDSHYVGVDVLYRTKSREYVVCEYNSC